MACNLLLPYADGYDYVYKVEDNIPNKLTIWKEGHIQMRKPYYTTVCLVGLKTHPTIVPRSWLKLMTSRLHCRQCHIYLMSDHLTINCSFFCSDKNLWDLAVKEVLDDKGQVTEKTLKLVFIISTIMFPF